MLSRKLAISMGVPVAPGQYVASSDDVRSFCSKNGYPVMIKALDGGGGRGIRLVPTEAEVEESFKRSRGNPHSATLIIDDIFTIDALGRVPLDRCSSRKHSWDRLGNILRFKLLVMGLVKSTTSGKGNVAFSASRVLYLSRKRHTHRALGSRKS